MLVVMEVLTVAISIFAVILFWGMFVEKIEDGFGK